MRSAVPFATVVFRLPDAPMTITNTGDGRQGRYPVGPGSVQSGAETLAGRACRDPAAIIRAKTGSRHAWHGFARSAVRLARPGRAHAPRSFLARRCSSQK